MCALAKMTIVCINMKIKRKKPDEALIISKKQPGVKMVSNEDVLLVSQYG